MPETKSTSCAYVKSSVKQLTVAVVQFSPLLSSCATASLTAMHNEPCKYAWDWLRVGDFYCFLYIFKKNLQKKKRKKLNTQENCGHKKEFVYCSVFITDYLIYRCYSLDSAVTSSELSRKDVKLVLKKGTW